jgi:hypothetical protein
VNSRQDDLPDGAVLESVMPDPNLAGEDTGMTDQKSNGTGFLFAVTFERPQLHLRRRPVLSRLKTMDSSLVVKNESALEA